MAKTPSFRAWLPCATMLDAMPDATDRTPDAKTLTPAGGIAMPTNPTSTLTVIERQILAAHCAALIAAINDLARPVPREEDTEEVSPIDVLKVSEVAVALRMGERQVREGLIRGEIPGVKIGGQWRVGRRALQRWIDSGGGN